MYRGPFSSCQNLSASTMQLNRHQHVSKGQQPLGCSLFSALMSLEFDPRAVEAAEGIILTPASMSALPKRAGEHILHHLLVCIDRDKATKIFRDCWPLLDKKRESQFYRAAFDCYKILVQQNIFAGSTCFKLPVSRSEVTPGSTKFTNTLITLTTFALSSQIQHKTPGRLPPLLLQTPRFTPERPEHNTTASEVLLANTLRQHDAFVAHQQRAQADIGALSVTAKRLVAEYRKGMAECDELRQRLQSAAEALPSSSGINSSAVVGLPLEQVQEDVCRELSKLSGEASDARRHSADVRDCEERSWAVLQPLVQATASLSHISASGILPSLPEEAVRALIKAGFKLPDLYGGESGTVLDLSAMLHTAELSLQALNTALLQQEQVEGTTEALEKGSSDAVVGEQDSVAADLEDSEALSSKSATDSAEVGSSVWQERASSLSSCVADLSTDLDVCVRNLKEQIASLRDQTLQTTKAAQSKEVSAGLPIGLWPPTPPLRLTGTPLVLPPTPCRYSPMVASPDTLRHTVLKHQLQQQQNPKTPSSCRPSARSGDLLRLNALNTPTTAPITPQQSTPASSQEDEKAVALGLAPELLAMGSRAAHQKNRDRQRLAAAAGEHTAGPKQQHRKPLTARKYNVASRLPAAAIQSCRKANHKVSLREEDVSCSATKTSKENNLNFLNVTNKNSSASMNKNTPATAGKKTSVNNTRNMTRGEGYDLSSMKNLGKGTPRFGKSSMVSKNNGNSILHDGNHDSGISSNNESCDFGPPLRSFVIDEREGGVGFNRRRASCQLFPKENEEEEGRSRLKKKEDALLDKMAADLLEGLDDTINSAKNSSNSDNSGANSGLEPAIACHADTIYEEASESLSELISCRIGGVTPKLGSSHNTSAPRPQFSTTTTSANDTVTTTTCNETVWASAKASLNAKKLQAYRAGLTPVGSGTPYSYASPLLRKACLTGSNTGSKDTIDSDAPATPAATGGVGGYVFGQEGFFNLTEADILGGFSFLDTPKAVPKTSDPLIQTPRTSAVVNTSGNFSSPIVYNVPKFDTSCINEILPRKSIDVTPKITDTYDSRSLNEPEIEEVPACNVVHDLIPLTPLLDLDDNSLSRSSAEPLVERTPQNKTMFNTPVNLVKRLCVTAATNDADDLQSLMDKMPFVTTSPFSEAALANSKFGPSPSPLLLWSKKPVLVDDKEDACSGSLIKKVEAKSKEWSAVLGGVQRRLSGEANLGRQSSGILPEESGVNSVSQPSPDSRTYTDLLNRLKLESTASICNLLDGEEDVSNRKLRSSGRCNNDDVITVENVDLSDVDLENLLNDCDNSTSSVNVCNLLLNPNQDKNKTSSSFSLRESFREETAGLLARFLDLDTPEATYSNTSTNAPVKKSNKPGGGGRWSGPFNVLPSIEEALFEKSSSNNLTDLLANYEIRVSEVEPEAEGLIESAQGVLLEPEVDWSSTALGTYDLSAFSSVDGRVEQCTASGASKPCSDMFSSKTTSSISRDSIPNPHQKDSAEQAKHLQPSLQLPTKPPTENVEEVFNDDEFMDGSLAAPYMSLSDPPRPPKDLLPESSVFSSLTESILAGETDPSLLLDREAKALVARESLCVSRRCSLDDTANSNRRRSNCRRSNASSGWDLTGGSEGGDGSGKRRLSMLFQEFEKRISDTATGIMDISDSVLLSTSVDQE